MILDSLVAALARTPTFESALAFSSSDADFSLTPGLCAPLLAGLLKRRGAHGQPPALFVITPTGREAESLRVALAAYAPNAQIIDFPAWETLPHERLSPSTEIVGRRLWALRQMRTWGNPSRGNLSDSSQRGTPIIVVASVRAALQPVADNLTNFDPVELAAETRGHDLTALSARLLDLGYTRVDMVTRRGDYAVRGGILDVFPPIAEHPFRIEFFGDEVEQIRAFSVSDQRSLPEVTTSVVLPASRELLLTPAVRRRAKEMQPEFPSLAGLLEKIAEGLPVEGMESLTPALVDALVPVTSYMPAGAAVAVIAPERVMTRAASLTETNREFLSAAWNAATVGSEAPIDLASGEFMTLGQLRSAAKSRASDEEVADHSWWTLSGFQSGPNDAVPLDDHLAVETVTVRVRAEAVPSFQGVPNGAVEHVGFLLRAGWAVAIVAQGHGTVERTAEVLSDVGWAARIVDSFPEFPDAGVAYIVQAFADHGFECEEAHLAVLNDTEFYGRAAGFDSRRKSRLAVRRATVVDPLQLKAGDHVVHETHGIGRFVELTHRDVSTGGRNGSTTRREYLVIEYAPSKRGYPGDKLYVPTDQLDLLSRYVGGDAPALSRMGGGEWAAAKGRARKAVRDIAVELVKLYSARMSGKGHAFAPDTPWQRELEDAFPFVETPDQLATINEVKADMERPIPMDRLLSGDVGFGKTEVAVRAAFKAVQDGKQVAMLVPTTLLVKQHIGTFHERFAGFPVHLRALSRFQSEREARETIAGLREGIVDVVIGTHRLLTESIAFNDLGLVIIDEEQRFGVEHKDTLKKLRTNVDILAMSATPIPRSLEMAVTGIREMSTLATPPEDRHPILTFVGAYSDRQIAAAIRRELLREGQIFFVHNRVSSIGRVAAHIAELVPEARVAVAHGQLPEQVLETVVVDFWERKFDVLVSTTIIETGLDIANANTIIIDRADKFGLSQLHQLRGRVGRGRERAYAYFLYDENMTLSETAHDRLSTIAANNDLGSGMQVALKDLEIRGAGNLLGAEQAGHIAGVGFDLYLRMIGEAVNTFRGAAVNGQTELRLELPVDAHIPHAYVDSERLRLEAYQKLSAATSQSARDEQLDLVSEELVDRYGELPEPTRTLIAVSRLRRVAQKAGLSDVVTTGSNVRIAPAHLADSIQTRLQRLYPGARYLEQAAALVVPLPAVATSADSAARDNDLIAWVAELLAAIFVSDNGVIVN